MKIFIFFFFITSLFPIRVSFADPVTQEDAGKIAISWYAHMARASVTNLSISDAFTLTKDGLVTLYVFNFTSGGFVIVAADDASIPILGYSENNPFPDDIACPAVKQWMEDYNIQIARIIRKGSSNHETIKQWESIRQEDFHEVTRNVGPLISSSWGQGHYYNVLCPADPDGPYGHCPTGCGNTAMAQMMKYHGFPAKGIGSNSYQHPTYGQQSADFANTVYDWKAMPDKLSHSNEAVATLVYHAGVSTNTAYTAGITGNFNPGIMDALVDHFNYHPEIEWHEMADFQDEEGWKDLLRDELDQGRPVFYLGYWDNLEMGHYFICDGYILIPEMSVDKFHFNWGWDGDFDGWYPIGSLNPADSFNAFNAAITNIKPYNPDLVVRLEQPENNSMVDPGGPVVLEASTVVGNAELMKITMDGSVVSTSQSNTLIYIWNPTEVDCGSHDIRAWAIAGKDTVWYSINLNVSDQFTIHSSDFEYSRQINSLSVVDSNIVWATALDGLWPGVFPCQDFTRTTDGGHTWTAGKIPDCEGLDCAMIFSLSGLKSYVPLYQNLFCTTTALKGIYVTSDGGSTWSRQATAFFSNASSCPRCIHFFNGSDGWCMGDPIFITGKGWTFEIYTTTDGGMNWIQVPADNIPAAQNGERASQTYSAVYDTIWFGTSQGRIYKSHDRGYHWTVANVPALSGKIITPVFRNGLHGLAHDFFIYPNEGRICETFDGGMTWTEIVPYGPVFNSDLDYVPGTENTWISSGGNKDMLRTGISVSTDGGHTWTQLSGTAGMDFICTTWLNPRLGWAGGINEITIEGGIFKFTGDLSSPSAIDDPQAGKVPFSVFPNPFSSNTTITLSIPETSLVNLSVYDISGRLQDIILSGKLVPGEHRFEWNAARLGAGVYMIRIEQDLHIQVHKVVIIHGP